MAAKQIYSALIKTTEFAQYFNVALRYFKGNCEDQDA